ncbi:MAG TPA: hypothetical protein VK509_24425 [Polyangiales bacterium]|nr:hypothetical protein [Polyangiales bacterium]
MQASSKFGAEVRPACSPGRLIAVVLALVATGCGELVDEPRSAGRDRDAATDGAVGVSKSALLLDNASATPVAAYSLALKLRAAYAGAALRVRRASSTVPSIRSPLRSSQGSGPQSNEASAMRSSPSTSETSSSK